MTTIALDKDLTLASDSQATEGNIRISNNIQKLWQIDGYRIAIAGRYAEALAFVEHLENVIEHRRISSETYLTVGMPDVGDFDNFSALVITPEDEVFLYEGSNLSMPVVPPVAIGSGSDFALSAMTLGKTADEAVAHAIQFDVFSGGEVKVITKEDITEDEGFFLDYDEMEGMTKEEIMAKLFPGYSDVTDIGVGEDLPEIPE